MEFLNTLMMTIIGILIVWCIPTLIIVEIIKYLIRYYFKVKKEYENKE